MDYHSPGREEVASQPGKRREVLPKPAPDRDGRLTTPEYELVVHTVELPKDPEKVA